MYYENPNPETNIVSYNYASDINKLQTAVNHFITKGAFLLIFGTLVNVNLPCGSYRVSHEEVYTLDFTLLINAPIIFKLYILLSNEGFIN